MGALSRNKGRRREREFLNLLGDELGIHLERNQNQSDQGGADCLTIEGWAIEVKGWEDSCFPTWWKQAERQAKNCNRRPVLAWKRNRQPWKIWVTPDKTQVLTIQQFANIIKAS